MPVDEIKIASKKEPGQRNYQQDAVWEGHMQTASGLKLAVAIVADGVGGSEDGHQASYLAIEEVRRQILGSEEEAKKFYRTLVHAITVANTKIFDTLSGVSNSTIVVAAVVEDESEYGRLFIAHVGDSYILLIRGEKGARRIVRLNTEHNIENEFLIKDEAVPDWVYSDPKNPPSSLSRALGQKAEIAVDLGIYAPPANSDKKSLNAEEASRVGQKGIKLQAGDTLLLSSDGLFGWDPNAPGMRYLHDEEIIENSLNKDPERTAVTLMGAGLSRGLPGTKQDNLSLALMFVPGKDREDFVPVAELPKGRIAIVALIVLVIFSILVANLLAGQATNNALQTQQANQLITEGFLATIGMASDTPQPTRQATETPTTIPTATPLPTNTPRPAPISPEQIGLVYLRQGLEEIREDSPLVLSEEAYFVVEGADTAYVAQQANFFAFSDTGVLIRDIETDTGRESLEIEVDEASHFFLESGSFATAGVSMEFARHRDLLISAQAACLGVVESPDWVEFACYDTGGACHYRLGSGDEQSISPQSRIRFVLNADEELIAETELAISFADALPYYDLIERLNQTAPNCLLGIVDADNDNFLDDAAIDECLNEVGTVRGCLDSDNDGVVDGQDACPRTFGRAANGCFSDRDGDGVADEADNCPVEFGLRNNNGCPRDSDRDLVNDDRDDCPNEYGVTPSGCPAVQSEQSTRTPEGSRG